jgi:hypothetical protein
MGLALLDVGEPEHGECRGRLLGLPIAASFIRWLSPSAYPDSSPSTTTDSAEASPNDAATVIERFANATLRPRSRNHAEIDSTNIAPVT